jgi:lipoprotein-releasing system permease protein
LTEPAAPASPMALSPPEARVPTPLPRLSRWLPFEWIVAIRFLREGRLQTAFIIGGIAIGVGVIVFPLA